VHDNLARVVPSSERIPELKSRDEYREVTMLYPFAARKTVLRSHVRWVVFRRQASRAVTNPRSLRFQRAISRTNTAEISKGKKMKPTSVL
jgi:hypothetical protein